MPTPPIRACLALDKCMSQIAVDEAHSGIFTQKVRNLRRRIGLGHPEADIHSVDFFNRRILDRTAVEEVATCGFIGRVENVALQGLTGMGKTSSSARAHVGPGAQAHFSTVLFHDTSQCLSAKILSRRRSPSDCD